MGENFKCKSNMISGNIRVLDTDTKNAGKLNSKIARMVKLNRHRGSWKRGTADMQKFTDWINNNGLVIAGAVFAFLISILSRKDGSILDRLSGAVLCSLFSTGLFYGIIAIFPNCPQEAAVAIGSFVGFYGVDEVKKLVLAKIRNFLKGSAK